MASEKPTVIDEEAAPAAEKQEEYIRFNSGDTLEAIAEKFDTTVDSIIERNNLNPAALQVGHWLYV